jgi:hypothetical protein
MQIKLDTFDFAPVIRGHVPVSNLAIEGVRVIQTAAGLRAANVAHYDRDNREVVISFSVVREHLSIEDAMAFAVIHQEDCPTKGTLTMTATYGVKTVRRYMENTVLSRVSSRASGILTFHSYELRGPKIIISIE